MARDHGADHIVHLSRHLGLAQAYSNGLEASLRLGADVIVNTDADNQYKAEDIEKLIRPILQGTAEMVIGDRGVQTQPHFAPHKRALQAIGSRVVSATAGFPIPDATSGFRAITRKVALETMVLSNYSYTLETLIQAGAKKVRVSFVPIKTNPPERPSRLFRSIRDYLVHSTVTIMRSFAMYRALRIFSVISALMLLAGGVIGGRFIFFYLQGEGSGMVQSLILAAVFLIVGFVTFLIGLIADLGHICRQSNVRAKIESSLIPLSVPAKMALEAQYAMPVDLFTGGDDYELIFTVPHASAADLIEAARYADMPKLHVIGGIVETDAHAEKPNEFFTLLDEKGLPIPVKTQGWQHGK